VRAVAGICGAAPRYPVRARAQDLVRFHGTDERIAGTNYAEMIGFHESLIRHATGTR
jgi:carboxypeptidase PM20D1